MILSPRTAVILAAGMGAVAPNLFKIAMMLTAGPVELPGARYVFTYCLGLLVLAVLGIGTVLAFKETNSRKAIFMGLGLPAFMQMSLTNVNKIYSPEESAAAVAPLAGLFTLGASAYADTLALPPRAGRRIVFAAAGEKKPESVTFWSADRKAAQTVPLKDEAVAVPDDAAYFAVKYHNVMSKEHALPVFKNGEAAVQVSVEQNTWGGLVNAIANGSAPAYRVEVVPAP